MMSSLSFREQQLLIEFTTFRATPLPGTYLSLHPSTPTIWYGAIFLRRPAAGIYTGIPIRFSITFPKSYPSSPPLVVMLGEKDKDGRVVGVVRHPLVVRARGGGSGGGRMAAGFSGGYVGAVNLKAGFPGWFEPRNVNGRPTPTNTNTTNANANTATGVFPPGTSPVEIVYWLRSIFTDGYLAKLQTRVDGDMDDGIIVDDEAWELWREDKEGLRRLVKGSDEDAEEEDEKIFGEWEGDAPIRFLDLRREALDTIKENLSRRVTVDGEA
ncbi:hypothetical protein ABW21_db0208206 [Orbilia brochopaga]|nr:hypothetical protein ABW21_db0208206 [Drechslerella brochopaga]